MGSNGHKIKKLYFLNVKNIKIIVEGQNVIIALIKVLISSKFGGGKEKR